MSRPTPKPLLRQPAPSPAPRHSRRCFAFRRTFFKSSSRSRAHRARSSVPAFVQTCARMIRTAQFCCREKLRAPQQGWLTTSSYRIIRAGHVDEPVRSSSTSPNLTGGPRIEGAGGCGDHDFRGSKVMLLANVRVSQNVRNTAKNLRGTRDRYPQSRRIGNDDRS